MYHHILLPTDGSEIATRLVRQCLALARESGASVTGVHVLAPLHAPLHQPETLDYPRAQYEREREARGRQCLAEIADLARQLGVPCETVLLRGEAPHAAILEAAAQRACDLICMATHGHGGIRALVLGSVTQQVLVHSTLPVLVLR